VNEIGNKIRELKTSKAPKEEILAQVGLLKERKEDYKRVTGEEWPADVAAKKKK
jgi:hypothetical protein